MFLFYNTERFSLLEIRLEGLLKRRRASRLKGTKTPTWTKTSPYTHVESDIIFPPRPRTEASAYAYVAWRGGAKQERRWHSSNLSARLCRLINGVRDYHAPRALPTTGSSVSMPRVYPRIIVAVKGYVCMIQTRAHGGTIASTGRE